MQEPITLVFATNNSHKLAEARAILGESVIILSLNDIGCHDDIPETADTFEGNALQKARWVSEKYNCDCFADDTGLEVDLLDGAPGVKSARYAQDHHKGDSHDSGANMRLLLEKMAEATDPALRIARFRTAVALIRNGKPQIVDGIVGGRITTSPRGADGFGYDPVFLPDGCDKTFAEMTADEKNAISHRGRAMTALLRLLTASPVAESDNNR